METKKSLENIDLVIPAETLHNAIVKHIKILSTRKTSVLDQDRLKELKVAVASMNALNNAFKTKVGYFRLTGVAQKNDEVARYSKRLVFPKKKRRKR